MDDDPALWGALGRAAGAPTLLVACRFDGALAPPDGDPGVGRVEQQSSEALNVLVALSGTTVAVVSDRPVDETAELMFLSGAKGGARVVETAGLTGLVAEIDPPARVAVGVDPGRAGGRDVVLGVDGDPDVDALPGDAAFAVDDSDDVIEILEELVERRRGA